MKFNITILLLTLFILHSNSGMAKDGATKRKNYIDSIETAQQIEDLIVQTDSNYKRFKVDSNLFFYEEDCKKLADSLKIQSWTKVDFDNNGLTDLLVIGRGDHCSSLYILSKGNNHYEIIPLTKRSVHDCTNPLIKVGNEANKIEYYHETPSNFYLDTVKKILVYKYNIEKKILVYKFNGLVEENVHPTIHKIDKIELSTDFCYGTCPVFELTINKDKSAIWNAKNYNKINGKEVIGIYKARIIDNERYNDIINMINYCDFEKLKDYYKVNWTDAQTCTLKITYDDGKTKTITDYGLLGTFGLDRLYQMLFALRGNQKWVK